MRDDIIQTSDPGRLDGIDIEMFLLVDDSFLWTFILQ